VPTGREPSSALAALVAGAYAAAPVEGKAGRFRRDWVIRTRDALPADAAAVVREVEAEIRAAIRQAYADQDPEKMAASTPNLGLTVLDPLHAVIHVEFARHFGDEDMIANWGTLRALDARWRIDDLNGIPRQFWFPLTADDIRDPR
jgi:hypothetical protein